MNSIEESEFNCNIKQTCYPNEKYLMKITCLYMKQVVTQKQKSFIDMNKSSFKSSLLCNKSTLKNKKNMSFTALSSYILEIQVQDDDQFSISWLITEHIILSRNEQGHINCALQRNTI